MASICAGLWVSNFMASNKTKAELTEELVIYPNPVQGELSVEGVSPGEQIIIADVLGRIVSVVNLPVSKSLDVSQLETGRYLLKIGQRSVSFVKQ